MNLKSIFFALVLTELVLLTSDVTPGGIAQAQSGAVNAGLVGRWNDYVGAYCDVWADGDYAYVPNWGGADGNRARVHVLDISNSANPVLVRTFFVPSPNRLASAQDVKIGDGLMFIGLEGDPNDGVAIVDIRVPTSPAQVATVRVPGFSFIHNFFYDNGFLYMPAGTSIAIVDLTSFDPDNPPPSPITTARWILNGVGSVFVHDVTVQNGRLYAAAWGSGLWIYDVSDVANTMPTVIGTVAGNSTHSMWATDDGKFVVTGEERSGGGIKVYEMIDNGGSLTLELRDSLAFPSSETFSVHNQMIVGNRLYNSWYGVGLQVYDINATTGLLEFVASFDTPNCWGVYPFLGDDRILLTDISGGFYIVKLGQDGSVVSPAAPHDTRKNRYISIDPSAHAAAPVALQVRLASMRRCSGLLSESCDASADCPMVCENDASIRCAIDVDCTQVGGACVLSGPCEEHPDAGAAVGWIDTPFDPSCQDSDGASTGEPCLGENLLARVVAAPVFRSWPETVIHVGDCEIVPAAVYEVAATADGTVFSPPLEVSTIAKPGARNYGDTVGTGTGDLQPLPGFTPPNGVVNVTDIQAFTLTSQGTSSPSVPVTWVDLHGLESGTAPNGILNVADLQRILFGFEGLPFTQTPEQLDPADCP